MTYMPYASQSSKISSFNGHALIPGDKSISHRSLMMGALTIGETIISGLLEGEDVYATAEAMRALGAKIIHGDDGLWRTHGVGIGGLKEPDSILDMGNSGTSSRLLAGVIGSHPVYAVMTGDASLMKRPMKRVMDPLGQMGVQFMSRNGGRLPLSLKGPETLMPIEYTLPVASAQVKSAILLAGLNAHGKTTVIENTPTRDHTENMLRHFGLNVETNDLGEGATAISVTGHQPLQPCAIDVPSDPSSAAFIIVAALLIEGSEVTLNNIGLNPRRTGLIDTLIEMGADITISGKREQAGEPVGDLTIKGTGRLKAIDVPPDRVPSMVDEFPILAIAAANAGGITRMSGLAELRVKESDRLLMMANGLKACGVNVEMSEDSLHVKGSASISGGATIETALDHRIAMSFLVLGMIADSPVIVDDIRPIQTSFPGFADLMNDLGASIEPVFES